MPEEGSSSPPKIASNVLLPEPLGPMTTTRSRSATEILTSDKTLSEPDGVGNYFDNDRASSMRYKPPTKELLDNSYPSLSGS